MHAHRAEHAIDLGQLIAQPLRGFARANSRPLHVPEFLFRVLDARGKLLHRWRDVDPERFHLRDCLGGRRTDAREFRLGQSRDTADPIDGFGHQGRVLNELPPRERVGHLGQRWTDLVGAILELDELRLRLLAGVEKAIEVREEFSGQLRHD
jgi:hypothetical protein